MLVPKLVTTLKTYTRAQLLADLTAGVIVGVVALPLAIAFAIASGDSRPRALHRGDRRVPDLRAGRISGPNTGRGMDFIAAPQAGQAEGDQQQAAHDGREGVEVYEINGPFFFGAAEKFKDTLSEVSKKPKVLIVRMRNVPAIDSTAIHALRDLIRRTRRDGTRVLLSDVQSQPLIALGRSGLLDEIGVDCLFGNIDEALAAARRHLGLPPEGPTGSSAAA